MYSIYVEQYPTASLNKYVDYLLYQEQVKKEQEALYYYRLRQQQQKAYLQQVQRLQEQERQRRLLLAYYEQQEKLRQHRLLQQEKLRQQQRLQEERLRQLEHQRRLFAFPSIVLEQQQAEEQEQEQEQDDEQLVGQLVDFLFGPEPSSTTTTTTTTTTETRSKQQQQQQQQQQEEPQRNVLTLDEFLAYISRKAQDLDNDDQEQVASSSKPVSQEEEEPHVVAIPITETNTTEPVVEEVSQDVTKEVSQDVTEEVSQDVTEEVSQDVTEEVPQDVTEEVAHDVSEEPALEAVTVEEVDEQETTDESEPLVASVQSLADGSSTTIQMDNQVLTADEFVDYISNKSKELFQDGDDDNENVAAAAEKVDEKQEKLHLLQDIQQELEAIRKGNEQHILSTQLDFSQSDDDSVSATTSENKEFLGYEDQIMKVLLKLDTIDSDGDDEIRTERKNLVKLANSMLNRLDEFKQKEWERASVSSHSEVEEEESDYLYV